MEAITFFIAAAFTILHIVSKYFKFLHEIPRSRLLSGAGGISTAYVFVHLLPELQAHHYVMTEAEYLPFFSWFEYPAYIGAMMGLALFYGLERFVKQKKPRSEAERHTKEGIEIFWIHIGSFFIYNALIGYLLVHREETGYFSLFVYAVAMGLHFLTNDHGLRAQHKDIYDQYGRWMLAFAVVFGWFTGVLYEFPEVILSLLFAFLSGGVILNVLKEELPEERESSFPAFFIGLITYSLLLIFA